MKNLTPSLLALCLLVGGCGGGGSGGGGEEDGSLFDAPEPGYPVLDEAAARTYAESAEFNRISPSPSAGVTNYALQNIHYAHTATLADGSKLRGQGMLIAVVDNGFRDTHREFAGKTIHKYAVGQNVVRDHGTAVAGIAAANAAGSGMMGVAPESDLHLTAWDGFQNNLLDNLAAATAEAATLGAVVQNNSWGLNPEIAARDEMAGFQTSGMSNYAEYIASHRPGSAAQWQGLFDAYHEFQKSGVIVFANSNDSALGVNGGDEADSSAWASLPLFVPELDGAWLVASNAGFTVDEENGRILSANLRSAPCGSAAAFCLVADGHAYAPSAANNTSYLTGSGTSFAAPQIAGQIALLAQAFPNLSPAEWTTRLLATAQRDWQDFKDSVSGSTTFAPGVERDHSHLYGHGLPDMKAALSPVGGLSIASGDNVFTARRTSLDGGIATAGPIVGNSLAKAIAGRRVMTVDALGTDFYVPGDTLAGAAVPAVGTAGARQLARNVEQVSASFAFVETEGPAAVLHDAAVPKLFFSQALANLESDNSFASVFPLGDGHFFQLTGQLKQKVEGSDAAFSLSRLVRRDNVAAEFSFSFGHSMDSFFGTTPRGPFVAGENTGSAAAGVGLAVALSQNWSLGAYAEFGSGFVGSDPHALVDYGAFAYASGGVSARRRGLVTGRDTLDLYAGLRPAALAGKADLRLPVGRDRDGTIHYENLSVNLAKADLPLRLGLVYRNRTERDFDVLFGFNTDFTAGSDPDPVLSFSIGLKKTF